MSQDFVDRPLRRPEQSPNLPAPSTRDLLEAFAARVERYQTAPDDVTPEEWDRFLDKEFGECGGELEALRERLLCSKTLVPTARRIFK